jgi:PAS domain-containing protein
MAVQADLFQDFLDSSDAVIYLKDKHGCFIMVNRRAAELLHMSKE